MLVAAIAGFATVVHTGNSRALRCGRPRRWRDGRVLWRAGDLAEYQPVCDRPGARLFAAGVSAFVGIRTRRRSCRAAALSLPLPVTFRCSARPCFASTRSSTWPMLLAAGLLVSLSHALRPDPASSVSPRSRRTRSATRCAASGCAVFAGGALCGLAGAYISIVYTPLWVEGMTAGKGWIALALTTFATWRPVRVLLGAYLFGGVTMLQFQLQGMGVNCPPSSSPCCPTSPRSSCWR